MDGRSELGASAEIGVRAVAARRTVAIASAVALLPFLALALRFHWLCDDAFISFRYSRHLAEGHGLRFNLSESPPVEGFSNGLWVLWLAPFARAGLDLGLVAQATSIACGAILIRQIARLAVRELALDPLAACATTLFFATLPTSAIWATSGLETLPFALALFQSFAAARSSARSAAIWACVACCLRADGVAWAFAALAASACTHRASARNALRAAAVAAIVVVLQFVARKLYFGDWLPNTAHAKVGSSALRLERGFDYSVTFFLTVVPCALVPVAALTGVRRHAGLVLAGLAMLAFATLGATWIGGDFMAMGRFFVPATPFVALLFAVAWIELSARARAAAIGFAALMVALSIAPLYDLGIVPAALRQRFHFRWNRSDWVSEIVQWRQMNRRAKEWDLAARAIALHTHAGESMVIDAIGVVGYRTELELYDVLGLVSREVAQRGAEPARASPGHDLRVEREFFLDREPDFVGAAIVARGAEAESGLPPDWRTKPWAPRLRIERRPLAVEDGFPPNCELRLFRLAWDA